MLFLKCFVHLAVMAHWVSAFYPEYPEYRCIADGNCPNSTPKRDVVGGRVSSEVEAIPALKIKQRLPTDELPHNARMGRYLERLVKKFAADKRGNGYNIATAVNPSQPNSLGLSQDGTDYSYFAQVKFGSNATPLWMLMDTGASATWVMATSCNSQACKVHNTYGPTNSKTYQATGGVFDIAYGTGHVSGSVATDNVNFAGFSLSLSFGVANVTSDDFLHFPFDGIMGLARDTGSYPTVLEAMTSAKVIKSNIFGVNIDRNSDGGHDGEINFGAPDPSKYSGSLSYTALSSTGGDWVITADGVGIDGKTTGITGRTAYIDTGTSYIFIPPADAKALHGLIIGSQLSPDGSTWYVPCSTTSLVQFSFSGVTYSVPSKDWIGGKTGGTLCTSNIFPGTPVGTSSWLLGDTFMKNVYTVFDSDQKRIGFGAKVVISPSSTAAVSGSVSSAFPSSTPPTTTTPSASGSMTSNIIPTGLVPTGGNSQSSIPSSPAPTSLSSGSIGFNAAITSSSMSPAAVTVAPISPASSTTVQASAGSHFEVYIASLSAILCSTLALFI